MQLKMTKKSLHENSFVIPNWKHSIWLKCWVGEHCFPLPQGPAEPSATWVPLAPAVWGLLPGLQGFLDSSSGAGRAQETALASASTPTLREGLQGQRGLAGWQGQEALALQGQEVLLLELLHLQELLLESQLLGSHLLLLQETRQRVRPRTGQGGRPTHPSASRREGARGRGALPVTVSPGVKGTAPLPHPARSLPGCQHRDLRPQQDSVQGPQLWPPRGHRQLPPSHARASF